MKDKLPGINLVRYLFASLLPVLLVAFWLYGYYVKLNDEMEITAHEITGIKEIDSFYQMLKITQQIRGLRMIDDADADTVSLVESLQKTLEEMVRMHINEWHAEWLGNKREFVQIARELKTLNRTKPGHLAPEVMFSHYARLIGKLIHLIRVAAENSHVAQDPRLQSYYMSDLVIRRLPVITEYVGRIRGYSVYQPVDEKGVSARAFFLKHNIMQVREELEKIRFASTRIAPIETPGGRTIHQLSDLFGKPLEDYLVYIEGLLSSQEPITDKLDLFKRGSQAIGELSLVYKLLVRDLNAVLQARLKEQNLERNRLLLGGVIGLLFIVFSIFWFYRNNLRTQIELSGTNHLLSSVQDSMMDALILIDEKGAIQRFNKSAEQIFGYRADEVLGQNINMLMPEPYHSQHDEYLKRYLREGEPRLIGIGREAMAKRKNGQAFPVELGVNEVNIDNRRIFNGVVRDLTERKRVEEELRRSVVSLESLHEITSDTSLDFSGKVNKLLALGRNVFGLDLAILSNIEGDVYTVKYIQGPEGAPPVGAEFDFRETYCFHTFTANGPTAFHHAGESRICRHPCYIKFALEAYIGCPVYVNGARYGTLNFSSATPKPDEFSQYDLTLIQLFAQWVGSEMSRLEVEENLRQFKSTLDQTLDCVFIFDAETLLFNYVNQGAMNQVGYTQEELMKMTPYDIKPDYDESKFREFIQPMMRGEKKGVTFETIHQHKNGSTIPVEIFLQYIAPRGERARFVAIVHDITERKKVDKLKNEFVSTVSHELRTPLTSIRGALGLIVGTGMSGLPEQNRTLLKIASNNTERLLLLINDILDIQKIESGHMRFNFRTVDLKNLIENSIRENESYGELHNVRFVAAGLQKGVVVFADPDRLMQVMGNLLSNAAKFSPAGSSVEVSMSCVNGLVRIAVRDHGAGIPKDFQAKIFDKFTQHDASDDRKAGGTGLGLSITKAIVEKHGGAISFVTGNSGTTFIVELPEIESATDLSIDDEPHLRVNTGGKRILVVEDDHDISGLIVRMLAEAGFDCDVAKTVQEAKDLVVSADGRYAAITLDILLPDDDGLMLIQYLRGIERFRNIPVIVVSCVADVAHDQLTGAAVGVVDWLNKPIDQGRLVAAVKMATTEERKPRILHLEDEADVRQIVQSLLKDKAEVTGCSLLSEARKCLAENTYDMILLDIRLPDGSGLDLLQDLQTSGSDARVIIFSAHDVSPEIGREVSAVLAKSAVSNVQLLDTIISIAEQNPG